MSYNDRMRRIIKTVCDLKTEDKENNKKDENLVADDEKDNKK